MHIYDKIDSRYKRAYAQKQHLPHIFILREEIQEMFPDATEDEITYAVHQIGNKLRPREIREDAGHSPRVAVGTDRKQLWVHASHWEDFKIEFGYGKYVFFMRVGTGFF
jgi:hypothetical protein